MAFPTPTSVATGGGSAYVSSIAVSLPSSIAAGDLLVVAVTTATGGAGYGINVPSGWTQLDNRVHSAINATVIYKVASGSEGSSVTVTLKFSNMASAVAFRITGAQSPPVDAGTGGTSTPNSPTLSPSWGSADTLWLTIGGSGGAANAYTAAPTSYSGFIHAESDGTGGSGSSSTMGAAYRQVTAATENPGAFTGGDADYFEAFTVAIQPATVPGAPTIGTATPTSSSAMTLTWSAPGSDGGSSITGYSVWRGTSSGSETLLTTLGVVTSFGDTGLSANTTYYYKVKAINAVGSSALSSEASGTTWTGTQPLTAVGAIATGQAFGTVVVTPGAVAITAVGAIATGQAFGTAAVTSSYHVTAVGAIASGQAFGTVVVTPGTAHITATGIASAGAFGTVVVTPGAVHITATGIASVEAFGTVVVAGGTVVLTATGIASGQAFGTVVVTPGTAHITATGIASGQAFGTVVVTPGAVAITGVGAIASGQAFGTTAVTPGAVHLTGVGAIATGQAFGTVVITTGAVHITGVGAIATAQAFGTVVVTPGAVAITGAGAIVSAEAFGATVMVFTQTVTGVGAIASAEAFGSHAITFRQWLAGGNIYSQEAFGQITLEPRQLLTATGIASAQAFGLIQMIYNQNIAAGAIASAEAFGPITMVYGHAIANAGDIASAEAFGLPAIVGGGIGGGTKTWVMIA